MANPPIGEPFDFHDFTGRPMASAGTFSVSHAIAQIASGALPHEFLVAAYSTPLAQISPVAVVLAGVNIAGAAARSPVWGFSARTMPSAGRVKRDVGVKTARAGAAAPLAGPSEPRDAGGGCGGAGLIRGEPFPGSPTSPRAGRGGRANPKNDSAVAGVRLVARVRPAVMPPGHRGEPANSCVPEA